MGDRNGIRSVKLLLHVESRKSRPEKQKPKANHNFHRSSMLINENNPEDISTAYKRSLT